MFLSSLLFYFYLHIAVIEIIVKSFHYSTRNLGDDDRKKRGEPKEEKKRRSSVFSKLGSYRQKKVADFEREKKNSQ